MRCKGFDYVLTAVSKITNPQQRRRPGPTELAEEMLHNPQ
jgi:hypothetical protein